ncbi:MAG: iron permease [Nitrosopumilaceae archaeon]|nr:FTR1 family iron permease [Nitrosopumilaceae archaeon]NIU02606.1 FTR1 family iron permease [Nitrosopumilaceae archaeon]NIU89069.1 iron permease [Nitrosopumilaceae archaeon]NIV67172.1 iron permease [Nitrosopumilaceae archaeon]NIX63207.1 iron permease [Nitrosopumilaceae archaeon]
MKFLISFCFFLLILVLIPISHAQEDALLVSTIEVTKIGTELTKTSLLENDYASAEKYSKYTNDFFGKRVNDLRNTDPELANDIHVYLLDIHAAITSKKDAQSIISIIDDVQQYLTVDDVSDNVKNQVVVVLLSEADQQYQKFDQQDEEESYQISKDLIGKADAMFDSQADLEKRLDEEIAFFFDDLENQVDEKSSFITVGNLITAIQRDILGTETVTRDYQSLYEKIRELYSQLLTEIDSGNFETAEELAIEAYLENYEHLEPPLEKVDPELMEKIEIDMREELRDMIINRQDPNIIRVFVEESILPDLKRSEELLVEYIKNNPTVNFEGSSVPEEELKAMGEASAEEKSGVMSEIDIIRTGLEETLAQYEQGNYESAYATARSAYLDSYEFVEIPLREIAPDFTLEVEYQFAELRNLINQEAEFEKVQNTIVDIRRNLDESERLVTGTGELAPAIAFSASFSLIFREGLEAVLILGAILTYLEASRNARFKPYVYYGIMAAIGATAVTWFITSYIIAISGASRELIEAIAALSATAVLFYVSFWVLNKIEHKKWMEFVKAKVWQATTTGSVMVFVMLSFFTVYREGFETVLFYQAMFGFAKYMEWWVGLGFVLGLATLFVIYYIMRRLGKKLPLRVLFGLTMGIGAYLSIAFLGNAIRELQVLDIIQYTPMFGTIPRLDINLATMTGIYPTLETIVGQIILLAIYLIAASYVLILRPRKEKRLAAMRKSRKEVDV